MKSKRLEHFELKTEEDERQTCSFHSWDPDKFKLDVIDVAIAS